MNPQPSTPKTNCGTNPHDISAITVTRIESFDPLRVIEEAAAQAQTERIVREHTEPGNPKALFYRFAKDDECDGTFIDLIIEGENQRLLSLVLTRLRTRDYNLSVAYRG
jgi:hypothetical protein